MYTLQDLILPLCSLIFLLIVVFRRRAVAARKKLPPSPWKLPIVGNLHQLGMLPHRSLHSLSKQYGHLMLLHLGNVPVVVASSAAAALEIMKNQDLIFANRPKMDIPDKVIYGSNDIVFSPLGEYWRQVRSICVVHLLSNKRVLSFQQVREEETSLMVEKIRRRSSPGEVMNLSDVLVALTNDVVCRVALGRRYGGDEEGEEFKKRSREFVELLGSSPVKDIFPWLAWINRVDGWDAKVEKVACFFDQFLERVLEEHRDERKCEEKLHEEVVDDLDLVDILLQFQRENKDSSNPVGDDTVKAIILDMLIAGTDTTVTALEWTMAELIRNPNSMQILQNEVRQVCGSKNEIDETDLEKMPYLKAVFEESLRLHAPAPLLIPRESSQDTTLLGYDIAAHTRVMVNAWAIARDPSVWKNPDEFRPERFLDSCLDFKGLHFEFIPFGAGRRGCPGIAFAMSVDELALAKLVHEFDFALPDGERGEDLDMSEATGMTIHKKLPLLVLATSHTDSLIKTSSDT